jgi:acyl dehydratase
MSDLEAPLTPELLSWVGRTVTYAAPEPVGAATIRYFARAVGDDNPIYTDAAAARAAGYRDVVAPPTWIAETVQYMDAGRDADGYAGHTWPLPVPEGYRTVRGGNTYELFGPVHPDTRLVVTWELESITAKRRMIFCESLVTYADTDGTVLATNRDSIIYVPPVAS